MHPAKLFRYCPVCSSESLSSTEERYTLCTRCGFQFFFNSAAAVGVLLLQENRVLLTVRNRDPGRGMLDLPGGFVDPGEGAEEAACREIREELGLSLEREVLRYAGSGENLYQYGNVTYRTLDLFFSYELPEGAAEMIRKEETEIAEIRFYGRGEFRAEEFAFPTHAKALERFFARTDSSGFS